VSYHACVANARQHVGDGICHIHEPVLPLSMLQIMPYKPAKAAFTNWL
jgi:hypothetical protein